MKELLLHAGTVFMGFFAIMNPVANTPIFIGLTSEDRPDVRRRIAVKSVLLAFCLVLVFCLAGKALFHVFGITLPAFRITGGILVFLIGYRMLEGNNSNMHHPSEDDNRKSMEAKLSVAVSPLAVPILGGPGTITTAMNYASTGGTAELIVTLAAFALLCSITCLFFVFGQKFVDYIGESAVKVVTRMMGLILAVMGVQMVIKGVNGAARMFDVW